MNIFQKVTLKNLKENRTRTLVTIIGIILSAAMFTAVTVSVSSLYNYMIQYTIYKEGNWHASVYGLPLEKVEDTLTDKAIEDAGSLELLGFSLLSDNVNPDKPYLCVYGMDSRITDLLPIHLTEGSMPQSSNEILLPKHLKENGGIEYQLGDVLNLELGIRTASDGTVLDNHMGYDSNAPQSESFTGTAPHTYTVTGFYKRPAFEDFSAAGYTALTLSEMPADGTYEMYFRTISKKDVSSYYNAHFAGYGGSTNSSLLRLYGASGERTYNAVLKSLASILTGIIMLGSISLIYNAFSISISERTRQFGLLSSIGATKRQLTGSVIFEAFSLSIIGIPLGILSGMLGIGITFYFTRDMITGFLYPGENVTLTLHPSGLAILTAVMVSLITILISAYLPARRALKKSALDAIRQAGDIAIRPRKIKTSPLTQKLFGFEGMLAAKNYKRNGKKYRATVFSLFISVVLFISASTFSAYLVKSMGDVTDEQDYDLFYHLFPNENHTDYNADKVKKLLSEVSSVTSSAYADNYYIDIFLNPEAISQDYFNALGSEAEFSDIQTLHSTGFFLSFLEDDVFRNYLKEQRLSEEDYFNSNHPQGILVDDITVYNSDENRYYTPSLFHEKKDANLVLYLEKEKDGYYYTGKSRGKDNLLYCSYVNQDDQEQTIEIPIDEACDSVPLSYGTILSESPKGVQAPQGSPKLYYPYSQMESVFSGLNPEANYSIFPDGTFSAENSTLTFTFQSEDHAKAFTDITKLLEEHGLPAESLTDFAARTESDRAMITVINIFSYGFITLISLIAAANVFNTISTNIILRRREFAMLKSMGMTPEGFQKMMNFECLLYGFKGLLYGLPTSVLVAWLIYRSISNGLELQFFIPWYSIVIAVGSVFLVVFSTMLYSMQKIKRENIMDTLKNENV